MPCPVARRPHPRRLLPIAAAVAFLAAPAAAGAAIHGLTDDLQVAPDGSVRLAVGTFSYRPPIGVQEYRLDAAGTVVGSRPLVAKSRRHAWADTAFTSDGAVAAYRVKGKRRSVIRSVIFGPTGPTGPAQTLSDPSHGAGGVSVEASPSGAAAIMFRQGRDRGGWQDMLAVRPAGAAAFRPAVPLGRIRRGGQFASDQPDRVRIAFAPDGSGAIAQVREFPGAPLRLRRIAADGTVSAAVEAAPEKYELASTDVAIAADGTIVAAFRAVAPEGDGFELLATTLPPGATATTPLQRLGDSGSRDDDAADVSLLLRPDGAPLLASRTGNGGEVQLFEGPATALKPSIGLPVPESSRGPATLVSSGDGGVSAIWFGAADLRRDAVMGSHLAPGGTWSAARPLTRPQADDPTMPRIGAIATAPGAGVVIAVEAPSGTRRGTTIELVRAP